MASDQIQDSAVMPAFDERRPLLRNQPNEEFCMLCRESSKIKDFDDIQQGDHIEMPLCNRWLPCKHHAIVEEIEYVNENDKTLAKLKVIDVPSAGKSFCLLPGPLEVQSRTTRATHSKQIKRVNYKKRRNNHINTYRRALAHISHNFEKLYNLCIRNCENFSVAMVTLGDPESNPDVTSVDDAQSLQAARIKSFCIHFFLSLFQYIMYMINFCLYAVYVRGEENDVHHGLCGVISKPLQWCYTGSSIRGFKTICDWLSLIPMVLLYIVCYVLLVRVQNQKRKYFCSQCLTSTRLVYMTKLFSYITFEIINIFTEQYVYDLGDSIKEIDLAWFVVAILSLLQLVVVFFLAPKLIVKYCILKNSSFFKAYCCCNCDFDIDSYKYVRHYA